MPYLLDANTFIQAKNDYYGFDICPGYWDWLERENAAGHIFSIDRIDEELKQGNDQLAEWASARGKNFFLTLDNPAVQAMPQVTPGCKAQTSARTYSGITRGSRRRRTPKSKDTVGMPRPPSTVLADVRGATARGGEVRPRVSF